MAGLWIEDVKCGIGENGMACGPAGGPVVAEIKVRTDGNETFYMCLAEMMGSPNFYRTEESTYDIHMDMDADEEVFDKLNEHCLDTGDYSEIFEDPEAENYDLYRLLIALVRADWDEMEELQKRSTGRYLHEIDIPVSDVEQDYLEETGYEEE